MKTSNLKSKTILVVHTNDPDTKFIFQKIKSLGMRIICMNKNINWANNYVDEWILCDLNNYNESILQIELFLQNHPNIQIDGVVTFYEEATILTSQISDHFGFTGINYAITEQVRNKYLFREFCYKNGIPAPKYLIIKNEHDLEMIEERLKFPIVMKPIYGSGSAFVIKIDSAQEVIDTYKYIQEHIASHPDAGDWINFDVLVEEYIDGNEVDIDIILQNGKIKFHSISDNYQTREPFFVETGQSIPSNLPQKEQDDLINMAEEALEKLGILNGLIHFEAKSSKTGPVPIEINLRMGGDEVYSFVKGAWGVDLVENAVKIATDIHIPKIKKPESPKKYITGKYFLTDYTGMLVNLEIKPEIKKDKNLEELYFFSKVGDAVLAPPEGYQYMGWMTVSGYNILNAKDNLKRLEKYVKYEVAKLDENSSLGKTYKRPNLSSSTINQNIILKKTRIQKLKKISSKNQANLKIGIACNHNDNKEESAKHLSKTLKERGYEITFFDFNNLNKTLKELQKTDIDLILNAYQQTRKDDLPDCYISTFLDAFHIPFTGSSLYTLALCSDKVKVKEYLNFHKIPTPKWDYKYNIKDKIRNDLKFPLIIKPANQEDLISLTNKSIVTNKEELNKEVAFILEELKTTVLIEEYIEGEDFNIGILGNIEEEIRVLPFSRKIFKAQATHCWNINTPANHNIQNSIILEEPAKGISKNLASLIREISLDTYNYFSCFDFGEISLRVDKKHNPYVIGIKPNPTLQAKGLLARTALIAGMDYGDFLEKIINTAINRYKKNSLHP